MNRIALSPFAALAVWPLASLAQVAVTDATHHQFVYVETTLEGSDAIDVGGSFMGDYSEAAAAALGDPIAAQGLASETSTTLADASVITGVLSADSYVSITDANFGYNYSASNHAIYFTLSADMNLVADFSILLASDGGSMGYFDLKVYDIDRQIEVFREDHWGVVDLTVQRLVPLTAGNYRVFFSVSAESHYGLSNGVYTSHGEASYSVAFVPTPGALFVLVTAACYVRRRR
jgi:hypothetical protein